MKLKSDQFKRDFGDSRQLVNAMDLTAEFHKAREKKYHPTPFGIKRDVHLGNLINHNVVNKKINKFFLSNYSTG